MSTLGFALTILAVVLLIFIVKQTVEIVLLRQRADSLSRECTANMMAALKAKVMAFEIESRIESCEWTGEEARDEGGEGPGDEVFLRH